MRLIDIRTSDGSRLFLRLPKTTVWNAACDNALLLPDAQIHNRAVSEALGGWFDFTYRGHRFLVTREGPDHCVAVRDPRCPDPILFQVAVPFATLLGTG